MTSYRTLCPGSLLACGQPLVMSVVWHNLACLDETVVLVANGLIAPKYSLFESFNYRVFSSVCNDRRILFVP